MKTGLGSAFGDVDPSFSLLYQVGLTYNQIALGYKSSTVPFSTVSTVTKKNHQAVIPSSLFTLCYMRELTWSKVRNNTAIKG